MERKPLNDTPTLQSRVQAKFKSRSMGAELLIVCALAQAMTILALFVDDLALDRLARISAEAATPNQ
jgi:hypothetical protein